MIGKKLRWDNLRINKCPKCASYLGRGSDDFIQCDSDFCEFLITEARMEELIRNMEKQGIERSFRRAFDEEENLSKLNGL